MSRPATPQSWGPFVGRSMSELCAGLFAFLRPTRCTVDCLIDGPGARLPKGLWFPGETDKGSETAGPGRTTDLLGAAHTHTHSITRQWHSYSGHQGGLCHQSRVQRQWVAASSHAAQTLLGPSSGAAEEGRGLLGGPRAWQGVNRQVGPAGQAGRKPPHSRDCSISSCFSTFVWLVSRISPARNISSTTV